MIVLLGWVNHSEPINPVQKVRRDHALVREVEVLRTRSGSGPEEIGIITPREANPEGPMSFALGRDEEIYILDQINSRVQVFKSGKRVKTIPILIKESRKFKDIALTPDHKIVLLGSVYAEGREKTSLYLLDPNGKTLNIFSLMGKLIPDSGGVTEIQVVKEGKWSGIWVELENRSVRIASLEGIPAERISVPGRLSLKGRRLLQAERLGDTTAVILRSKEDSLSQWDPERTIHFEMAIVHLLGIWDDQEERIYLGAFLEDADRKGKRKYSNEVVLLSPDFNELRRVKLMVQKAPHEIWRPIRISPEGLIYQMVVDDRGISVRKYSRTD